MQIKQIKNLFQEELKSLYPESEVAAITELTLEHVLNYSKIDIQINQNESISPKNISQLQQILTRLKRNEPIQYIIGIAHFYGYKFKVNPAVLIPRQETELLVDYVCKTNSGTERKKILDIGTGSGCIAISIACEMPQSEVYALDISNEAILVASENADLNKAKINFITCNIFNFRPRIKFDYILSNPPYVRESEKTLMHPNVVSFEPESALFVSDKNPFVFYKVIASFASNYLEPNGTLMVEINEFLSKKTAEIFIKEGFNHILIKKDLNEKDRFLIIQQ